MTSQTAPAFMPLRVRGGVWWLLGAFLVAVMLVSLSTGNYQVPVNHVVGILVSSWWPVEVTWTPVEARVVELIRLPRVLIAALVGASLALAGAALQGALRNPLVGPQIVGVSSGAALGGVLALFLALGTAAVIGSAFVFGALAMLIAYSMARVSGNSSPLTLVLAGIVVSAFCSALVSLLTYLANPEDSLPTIVYWLMGSFATASFDKVWVVGSVLLLAGLPLVLMRFRINVLSLGDEEAQSLGIPVERTRWAVLALCTALVAASVSVSGVVDWVGLVIPHFARLLLGPDHRKVLPASMLMGAAYMVIIDTLARSLTSAEIPLGVLTAIVGAPIFAWLLRQSSRRGALHD